ncbi:MAG: HNH endonuclease, partial [Armatimonadetes bacterium]|nr:HNH endonuclease [Armatimonadota bacterium]
QIDAHLQGILTVERRFQKHFLWMLETFRRGNCHLVLEFPSFQHYCEDRLGISPSHACGLVWLQRSLRKLPTLAAALHKVRVNRSQAMLIAQVASRGTVDRWIAHAATTTVRLLQQDVRVAEWMRERDPERFRATAGLPATGTSRAAGGEDEQDAIQTGAETGIQTRASSSTRAAASPDFQTCANPSSSTRAVAASLDLQTCANPSSSARAVAASPDLGTCAAQTVLTPVTPPVLLPLREHIKAMLASRNDEKFLTAKALIIRFKLPGRVVTLWEAAWRAVSHLMGKYAGLDDVMEYLLDAYLQENVRDALASIRTHRLLDRRGWRCANPTCSRRDNLHGHHVKFRSHGGGDEETNIAYLCRSCHLRGVHEGWITVSGIAPDGLVWVLGTSLNDMPHMVVAGRNVVAGACLA